MRNMFWSSSSVILFDSYTPLRLMQDQYSQTSSSCWVQYLTDRDGLV